MRMGPKSVEAHPNPRAQAHGINAALLERKFLLLMIIIWLRVFLESIGQPNRFIRRALGLLFAAKLTQLTSKQRVQRASLVGIAGSQCGFQVPNGIFRMSGLRIS